MANKARYYGLSTREERQDVTIGSGIYPETNGQLTYGVVATAVRNYKANHPNFDNLTTQAAAEAIARELDKRGVYGEVTAGGGQIRQPSEGYAISLTKSKDMITVSHASERTNIDKKKKKK